MKKRNITLLTALAAATALAPTAQAEIVVPPLGYEGTYRVVFQTSAAGSYDYTTMAAFDAWATGLAQAAGAVDDGGALGTTWSVIGATVADPDILSRTSTHPVDDLGTSCPIYLVDGTQFAPDYATFWSSGVTITDKPNDNNDYTLYLTEKGNIGDPGAATHTGLTTNGTDTLPILAAGQGLDSTVKIRHGGGNEGYNNAAYPWYAGRPTGDDWWDWASTRVFAISDVLTAVAPTEATILISGLGTFINPGDTTPSTADDTDFGEVIMGGTPIVTTYTVTNFGTVGTLNLTGPPTVTGGEGRFTVSALSATVLAPAATATFTVTYTPVSGSRSVDDATVSLASDAADNNPYTFDITATTLNDGVITTPGDGYTGDYRIAFVTTGMRGAKSTDIADYNDFVTTAADAVPELLALSTTWKCIGSTLAVSAKVNTSTDSTGDANDVPIYTTTGLRIADDNADLWDSNIQNPIFYGDGTANSGQIWTGTKTTGASADGTPWGWHLGVGPSPFNIVGGGQGRTDAGWIMGFDSHDGEADNGNTYEKHFYGMSGVITPGGSSSPYDDWATGSELFGDDANGDGVDNGLAWILGADDPDANALGKLPVVSEGGSFLILDFTRENPYTPATLSVQFGNDLSGWEEVEIPAGAGNISASGDDLVLEVTAGPPDSLKLKIPTSYESAGGALFARLVAREN